MNTFDEYTDPGMLQDGELTLRFISFAPHQAHLVPTYHFRMTHADTAEDMGRINLRAQTNDTIERYAGHIGYAVQKEHRSIMEDTETVPPRETQAIDIYPGEVTSKPWGKSCGVRLQYFVPAKNVT